MEEKKKIQKKNKPKFSFYLVSFLLVFCIVGSLLGTIAFCQNNCGTNKVNADDSIDIVQYDNIFTSTYQTGSYQQTSFNFNVLDNSFVVYKKTSLSISSYLNLNSHFSLVPGYYTFYVPDFYKSGSTASYDSYIAFTFYDSNGRSSQTELDVLTGGVFYTVNILPSTSYCTIIFVNKSSATSSFSIFVWQGQWNITNVTESMKYQIGYSQGILDNYDSIYQEGYNYGVNNISSSLGVFQNAEFRYKTYSSSYKFDNSNDYSSFVSNYSLLPSQLNVLGYYQGVNFVWQGQNTTAYVIDGVPPYTLASADDNCTIRAFFRQPFLVSSYPVFNVNRLINGVWYTSASFGTSLVFYFTDGSYKEFNQADDYFAFADLSDNISKSVFAIDFVCRSGEGEQIFSLNSNSVFTYYYNQGYQSGLLASDIDNISYNNGYRLGYQTGYESAKNTFSDYTFTSLIGAVIDAPITALRGLLNFEILGVNLLNFFFGILTIAIIIFVIRLFL